MAAFAFLGLIAAGEEIEQPFGGYLLHLHNPSFTPSLASPSSASALLSYFILHHSLPPFQPRCFSTPFVLVLILTTSSTGYDENDLGIESFISVVKAEIKTLKNTPGSNAVVSKQHGPTPTRRGVVETTLKSVEKKRRRRKTAQKQKQAQAGLGMMSINQTLVDVSAGFV